MNTVKKCVIRLTQNNATKHNHKINSFSVLVKLTSTRMWASAQRDGRPAECRWRPLFNAAVWLTPTTRVPCSNAAKTRNQLKLPGVPQTNETISAASGPKFTILWGHVEGILLLNKFFFRLSIHALVMVALWNRADHYIFALWFLYGRPM